MTANAPTNSGYWTDAGNYATSFAGGSGTSTDPYLISTPQQLAYLSYLINTTSGNTSATYGVLYYKQTANIDCSLYYWDPIGYHANYSFKGNYNGGGYTISGLYTSPDEQYTGLFGYIYGATIHDVSISNSAISGYLYVGSIAGYAAGYVAGGSTIYNCNNQSDVTVDSSRYTSGNSYVGGIVGSGNNITINDCFNIGEIIADLGYVGGIAGYIGNNSEVYDCYNNGAVSSTTDVGGIVGFASASDIENCNNTGNITANQDYAGGIAGRGYSDDYQLKSIINCYNLGTINASNYAGGIAGFLGNQNVSSIYVGYDLYNCYNTGDVSATNRSVGGIVGWACQGIQIYTCYSEGIITGTNQVGGIVGETSYRNSNGIDTVIYNCYNTGDVSATNQSAGGIVGYFYNPVSGDYSLYNCYNVGTITGDRYAGGIIGEVYKQSYSRTYIYNSFNIGAVTGGATYYTGGIIGYVSGSSSSYSSAYLYNSYWGGNCTASSVVGSGTITRTDCGSCTIDNAKDINWYTNSSNWHADHPWDFETTWGINSSTNDGYPILVPILEITSFTITYHPNGASGDEVVESKVGSESYTIRSNMFTRSGYNFTGWNTQANGGGTSYSAGSSYSGLANLDLYAQWSRITYTIKYNKNASDATGSMANTTKYYGTNVTLRSNAFKRTGYSFAGWATEKNGDVVYSNGATYSANANVTLYAKWDPHKYTIVFNGNGSTSGSMKEQTFEYGKEQKLTSNAFKKTGFTFSKWTRNADGTGTSYTNGQSVKNLTSTDGAEINLWAQWKARNEAKYDSAGKYWYVENGKIPQTKVTNSTLISNLNKATTNGSNYYIAGQTLTAKVYSGKEYCKWNNNWYEVEPIRWRLTKSSSQKDGYGTTTDTNAVLAEIVYVDQYSSTSIDANEGYSNQSVTDFMRNGISTTYLVNYATSTQTFGTGSTLYGTNASTTARMFVSSQSEITNVVGNMNMTFSDLVEDMIKYYGGTNVYFTRDLGSNYNNIVCFNEVGREVQRFATDYRGVQFTVRFTEYGCVN